jgi:hypothetical protein
MTKFSTQHRLAVHTFISKCDNHEKCKKSVARCFKKHAAARFASVGYNIILTAHGLRPACLIPQSTVPPTGSCLAAFMQNLKVFPLLTSSALVYNPDVVNVDALARYTGNRDDRHALGMVLGYQTPFVRGTVPRMLRTVYNILFNGIEVYSFVDHGGVPNAAVIATLKEMATKWDETLNGLGLEGATVITAKSKRRQEARRCSVAYRKLSCHGSDD